MTEERARHYSEALAHSMGVTFYLVRSREGRFLAVQIPSHGCEVLAMAMPSNIVDEGPRFGREQVGRAA
jgi:hypothetical protein